MNYSLIFIKLNLFNIENKVYLKSKISITFILLQLYHYEIFISTKIKKLLIKLLLFNVFISALESHEFISFDNPVLHPFLTGRLPALTIL